MCRSLIKFDNSGAVSRVTVSYRLEGANDWLDETEYIDLDNVLTPNINDFNQYEIRLVAYSLRGELQEYIIPYSVCNDCEAATSSIHFKSTVNNTLGYRIVSSENSEVLSDKDYKIEVYDGEGNVRDTIANGTYYDSVNTQPNKKDNLPYPLGNYTVKLTDYEGYKVDCKLSEFSINPYSCEDLLYLSYEGAGGTSANRDISIIVPENTNRVDLFFEDYNVEDKILSYFTYNKDGEDFTEKVNIPEDISKDFTIEVPNKLGGILEVQVRNTDPTKETAWNLYRKRCPYLCEECITKEDIDNDDSLCEIESISLGEIYGTTQYLLNFKNDVDSCSVYNYPTVMRKGNCGEFITTIGDCEPFKITKRTNNIYTISLNKTAPSDYDIIESIGLSFYDESCEILKGSFNLPSNKISNLVHNPNFFSFDVDITSEDVSTPKYIYEKCNGEIRDVTNFSETWLAFREYLINGDYGSKVRMSLQYRKTTTVPRRGKISRYFILKCGNSSFNGIRKYICYELSEDSTKIKLFKYNGEPCTYTQDNFLQELDLPQ